jgi:hypothetical protein
MEYLTTDRDFSNLSLVDLLAARDQFHAHLMHKRNVVATAVGRYLIRSDDPYPTRDDDRLPGRTAPTGPKPPRTLENSEVREYSWPCVMVFVREWVEEDRFGARGDVPASDFIPKTIYLPDGRTVPVCVVLAEPSETAPPPLPPESIQFPTDSPTAGCPIFASVQGAQQLATLGCLVTDGHKVYGLTSRHVAGQPGEELWTRVADETVIVGRTSGKQLGRLPFERVYESWPGRHIYVNVDVGLVELADVTQWNPSVFKVGRLGPLADLSVLNFSLNIIGCPVAAQGCASGRLSGRVAALFYRYKSVGGFEYVADFLIGPRGIDPLLTQPGDSGLVWVVDSDNVERDRGPLAVQWGGAVFASSDAARMPFALATNLSTVCRELEVDLFRARELAAFEYWGAVGHYTVGALACDVVTDARLRDLMRRNRVRVSFAIADIEPNVDDVTVPGFVPLADVPDKVWKKTKTEQTPYGRKGQENPSHYADMDFKNPAGNTLDDLTPNAASLVTKTWADYYRSVGWNAVSQRGLLPFRVWQLYKEMVARVAAKDVAGFVAAAGVLAHYVGDACQPLHSSYLDDGDPFRQPDGTVVTKPLDHGKGYGHGVHEVYEKDMIDEKAVLTLIPALRTKLKTPHTMTLVTGGQAAGFAVVELTRRTRAALKPMDIVEAYAKSLTDLPKNKRAGKLWDEFGAETTAAMVDGCRTLAMLWDSAWAEGGGDQIEQPKIRKIMQKSLQKIYQSQEFVPSKALGKIDPYL